MSNLRKVIGVTGDRVWVENDNKNEELTLYVNGGGSLIALSPSQAEFHGQTPKALEPQPLPAESPKGQAPDGPSGPTGHPDQPLNPNEPS